MKIRPKGYILSIADREIGTRTRVYLGAWTHHIRRSDQAPYLIWPDLQSASIAAKTLIPILQVPHLRIQLAAYRESANHSIPSIIMQACPRNLPSSASAVKVLQDCLKIYRE